MNADVLGEDWPTCVRSFRTRFADRIVTGSGIPKIPGRNIITPDVLGYVRTADGAAEISTGHGLIGERIYAVTWPPGEFGSDPRSACCHDWEEVEPPRPRPLAVPDRRDPRGRSPAGQRPRLGRSHRRDPRAARTPSRSRLRRSLRSRPERVRDPLVVDRRLPRLPGVLMAALLILAVAFVVALALAYAALVVVFTIIRLALDAVVAIARRLRR